MKRIVREYGMAVLAVAAAVLLLGFWWSVTAGKNSGMIASIGKRAEETSADNTVREKNEWYGKLSQRSVPEITYWNQPVYAGELPDWKKMFAAVDADRNVAETSILTVNGKKEETASYCFPRSGVYKLEVEAEDSYGLKSRRLFSIPVSRKR